MSVRTIAIGDIHGCSKALRAIIDVIQPTTEDTLVLLGDYVDRGPDSRGVVDFILELEHRCRVVPLLGNHELMLLDALQYPRILAPWLECGGDTTVRSYDGRLSNIPQQHLDFLHRCKRYHETATHFFVHANYAADLALDQQPDDLRVLQRVEQHQFVISQQRDNSAMSLELQHEIDYASAVGPAIEVIAQEHERVIGCELNGLDDRAQCL